MKRILFVCTGNSCRSQIAEALAKQSGKFKITAFSAGISPIDISSYTYKVVEELGIDMSDQKPKSLESFVHDRFDFVVALSPFANSICTKLELGETKLFWDIEDPYASTAHDYGEAISKFRDVRDQIKNQLNYLLETIPEL